MNNLFDSASSMQSTGILNNALQSLDDSILIVQQTMPEFLIQRIMLLESNPSSVIPPQPPDFKSVNDIFIGFLEASLDSRETSIMNFFDPILIDYLIILYYRIIESEVVREFGKRPSEILMAFVHYFCVHTLARTSEFNMRRLYLEATGNYVASIFKDFLGIDSQHIGYPTTQAPYSSEPFPPFVPPRQRTPEFTIILKNIEFIMINIFTLDSSLIGMFNDLYDAYLKRKGEPIAATALLSLSSGPRGGFKRKSRKSKKAKNSRKYKKSKKSKKSRKI